MISSGQKVFGIEHLVAKILKSNGTIECLKFRTINKTFDNVIQRRFCQDYQELIIGYDDISWCHERERIFVSENSEKKEWATDSIWTLFEILNKTDKPILKSVNLRNIPDLKVDNVRLHSELLNLAMRSGVKKFFEMHQLCPEGCDDCLQVALGCREYGPMQPKVFNEAFLENKKHFEVLIVSESLLCEIAKMCVQNSETKEQCLQELEKLITSNISCDVLVLQMQDKPHATGFSQNYATDRPTYKRYICESLTPPSGALPLEVIDRMITEWKVKSLKLKFQNLTREPAFSKVWSEKKLFTEIYMDKDIRTVRPLEHHLESVDIDLSVSWMYPFPVSHEGFQVEHLVGNIRKLFPAKKYSIVTNNLYGCDFHEVEECFTSLLEAVWIDGSKNIEVFIRHFPWSSGGLRIQSFRVPSSFRGRPLRHLSDPVSSGPTKVAHIDRKSGVNYCCRSFELEDESTQCKFKAEVLISFTHSGIHTMEFENVYTWDVQPFGQGDPNSLFPLVYAVCDPLMEQLFSNSRWFGFGAFQGPLNSYEYE